MWSPISEWSVLLEDKLMRIDFVNGFKRCLAVCIIALITVTSVWGQETRNRTTYYHSTLQGTPVAATNESGYLVISNGPKRTQRMVCIAETVRK